MELASCRSSGAYNFEVTPEFWKNMGTSVLLIAFKFSTQMGIGFSSV